MGPETPVTEGMWLYTTWQSGRGGRESLFTFNDIAQRL